LLSLPLGLLVSAFLWINEFPDYLADGEAGKRTLVVQLGKARARKLFGGIVGVAYLGLLLLPQAGLPRSVLLGVVGFPWGVAAGSRVLAADTTARLIPAQGWTLLSFLLYALGAGAGLILF
jgi:1,4-dihydroxy-2-naphthoate octaprenyltransferase